MACIEMKDKNGNVIGWACTRNTQTKAEKEKQKNEEIAEIERKMEQWNKKWIESK